MRIVFNLQWSNRINVGRCNVLLLQNTDKFLYVTCNGKRVFLCVWWRTVEKDKRFTKLNASKLIFYKIFLWSLLYVCVILLLKCALNVLFFMHGGFCLQCEIISTGTEFYSPNPVFFFVPHKWTKSLKERQFMCDTENKFKIIWAG